MKLRYYLRGLAVGILLTTIVLTIANAGKRPLTDAQIIQRALELGMVEGDSRRLSALRSSTGESGGAEPGDSSAGESSVEESESEQESIQPEGNSETMPVIESSTAGTAEAPTQTDPDLKAVTIRITGGDSSYSVSRRLAEAGLVEDAASFDSFLCDNGYSKSIHTGVYEILPGTSEEDIAKIIAY